MDATTHITRPFEHGKYLPSEQPFVDLSRMFKGKGEVKQVVPEMIIFTSEPSCLRQFYNLYSVGAIEDGICDGILFGCLTFADTDFKNEIIKDGRIDQSGVS